ncbi:MAG: hypothetical protein HYX90_02285 [Chloroflexi bacterium]|nr:hypothetical protein [Chloroflexota bacterium]
MDPQELRQWQLLPEGLAGVVARLLGLKDYQEIVKGRAWRLGITNLDGLNRDVVMVRGLGWADHESIRERISTGPVQPVTVIPHETSSSHGTLLPLSRVLRLRESGVSLDNQALQLIASTWNAPVPAEKIGPDFQHSADYRWVRWRGQEFRLSKRRGAIVGILHQAYRVGRPVMSWDQIKAQVRSDAAHMSDLFKKCPAWGSLIIEDGPGLYRLDL